MYNRIRQIHLFAAFILTVFVLMYFISGFVMIFEFERKDTSARKEVKAIAGIRRASGDSLVALIRSNFDISGQYQVREGDDRTVVNFRHPGTETNVVIPAHADSVTVTVTEKNFVNTLHQFHRLHGYHGGLNYRIWAFVYDLSSLSMIIFALTGVYLWYKTERTRWPGWIILIASTIFTAFTIYYLHYLE